MTTFTTEDRENASWPPHIIDSGASVSKEQFEKSVKVILGDDREVKIEEVDEGVYVVEISKKEDDFDMDERC